MFTEINKHTTVKRYGEIISFLKQYEVEIRDNEKIPVHITKNLNKKKAPCFSYGDEFLFLLTLL